MNRADLASVAPKDRSVSIAPAKVVPRLCSVCGCPDEVTVLEGEYDVLGNKAIRHLVTVELRYLRDRQPVPRGWRRKVHQGRQAMERYICRGCLASTREMSEEFRRKRDKELGAKNFDPYYLAVCGE